MRIDKYLAEKYGSRTKSAEAISKGLVKVNGKSVAPSYELKDGDILQCIEPKESYVSNGGYKLSKAIQDFHFNVAEKIFADIGASNGGFTDCLFQNGAEKVYCIDVGESQLDSSLMNKNVVVIDKFNARNLNNSLFTERLDAVVIDVSFISLTYILHAVSEILTDRAEVIALIKPQFECENKNVGKNGIVKKASVHIKVIEKIYNYCVSCNLAPIDLTTAPIIEGKNVEYLIRLVKGQTQSEPLYSLIKRVTL